MKVSWLRWIPRAEGEIKGFLAEASQYGVAANVPLEHIKALSWRDEIYCAKKEAGKVSGIVFAKFPVWVITGLSEEGRDALAEDIGIDEIMPGGQVVRRRGFSYVEAETYSVNATIQEVAAALRKVVSSGGDPGHVMVGGDKSTVEPLDFPWPIITEVPVFQGVRQFDAARFMSDVRECDLAGEAPRLPGQYLTELELTKAGAGYVQVVKDYEVARLAIQSTFDFAGVAE